jgi:hypothetical protein
MTPARTKRIKGINTPQNKIVCPGCGEKQSFPGQVLLEARVRINDQGEIARLMTELCEIVRNAPASIRISVNKRNDVFAGRTVSLLEAVVFVARSQKSLSVDETSQFSEAVSMLLGSDTTLSQ